MTSLPPPRPSSCIVILSPRNQVLLVGRGAASPAFASAHVFPGGNLDPFHDGEIPDPTDRDALHADGPAFRLAAVRESFEEAGILLARPGREGGEDALAAQKPMLVLDPAVAEEGRRRVKARAVQFGDWVAGLGGTIDTDGLVPFTRWITPITSPARFTTQMYLYFLPLPSDDEDGGGGGGGGGDGGDGESITTAAAATTVTPTPDGGGDTDAGGEVTSAAFALASTWLRRADQGQITLYPPQYYLLHLVARFTSHAGPAGSSAVISPSPLNPASRPTVSQLASQRAALLTHVHYPSPPPPSPHPAASPLSPARLNPRGTALMRIPPGRRVICPRTLFVRGSDGRVVLGLDEPGPDLLGTTYPAAEMEPGEEPLERGGDGETVVVVAFGSGGAGIGSVEIRSREEVLSEERAGGMGSNSLAASLGRKL